MKEEKSENQLQPEENKPEEEVEEGQERDSLISERGGKIGEELTEPSEKLNKKIRKQNEDFFDVYDLVGSFQFKTDELSQAEEKRYWKNFSRKATTIADNSSLAKNYAKAEEQFDDPPKEEDEALKEQDPNVVEGNDQDTTSVNARIACLHSDRYTYQYFLFFCISLFQAATAFFYYEVDYNLYYIEFALKNVDNINPKLIPVVKNEIEIIKLKENLYHNIQSFTLRSFYVTCVCIVVANTFLYMDYINWKRSLRVYGDDDKFLTSPMFKNYLFEQMLLCICPFNFLNGILLTKIENYIDYNYISAGTTTTRPIKLNYIFLTIFIIVRVGIFVRFMLISSYYWSPRAQRFCKIYVVDLNFAFVVKSLLRSYPFYVLLTVVSINLLIGAYLVRIFERLFFMTPYHGLNNYFTCLWYCFISMMTVGYGDYAALSVFGRFIILTISLGGVFILAMTTVVFTEVFTFKGGQLKAYNLLKTIYGKEDIINRVKELVVACGMIIITTRRKKRNLENLPKIKQLEKISNRIKRRVYRMLGEIKQMSKKFDLMGEINYIDMFNDQLIFVKNQLKEMDEKIERFSNAIKMSNDNKRDIITIKNCLLIEDE